MALIPTIEIIKVTDSGENFRNQMYAVSAKLTLSDDGKVVLEQTFSENHKSIYSMPETMDKIRKKMDAVKKKYEAETLLLVEAKKEITTMTDKLTEAVKDV